MNGKERAEREKSWATRVLERRLAVRLTQAQVAQLAGITQQALSRIEHNEVVPRIRTMERLARALGISVEELFPMSSRPTDRVAS